VATQEEVLFALNETSDNLFITGDAGTGKSWVVNTWLESLPQGFPIASSVLHSLLHQRPDQSSYLQRALLQR